MLEYINSSNEIVVKLQQYLAPDQNTNSELMLIELKNIPILISLYGQQYIEQTLTNLKESLTDLLQEKAIIEPLAFNYICVFFPNIEHSAIELYAKQIHDFIQLFYDKIDSNTERPIHLSSILTSISLPAHAAHVAEGFEKALISLEMMKNGNVINYYSSFTDIQDHQTDFKKKYVLACALKSAVIEKSVRLAFQPIVHSKTGETAHYESLLRMVNNEGRIISAGPFIPIAEEMGFINFIDELVLEMVVSELKASPNVTLAFNLSALGVHNKDWLKIAQKALQNPNIASRLMVEITETAAQQDLSKTAYFVASLQEMGCQVALDDFGSGHTSFRQLKALSVDVIKIDGAFIRDIVNNPDNLLFVKALLSMSKGFGFESVAEFVENGEIAKLLMGLDVNYMQGNYFCPAVNYRSWVKEN
jgi:EAL domain-containing protein (putative c-di-GMP-specific phosphodiesterase class I)